MIDQLKFMYEAGLTKRFHTMHVLRTQTIADHSWHVAMLGFIIYGQAEPGVSMSFMMALLTHDAAEYKVGDVPSPAKRGMGELLKDSLPEDISFFDTWGVMEQNVLAEFSMDWDKLLTQEERRRLELLDAFEGAFYCVTERSLGNQGIAVAFNNYCRYIGRVLEDIPDEVPMEPREKTVPEREWEAFTHLKSLWEQVNG